MGRAGQKAREESFLNALNDKNIPILTLDHKWHRLFEALDKDKKLASLKKRLNDLLKRQGKLNTEIEGIRKLKKKLMNEIVPMVDELDQGGGRGLEKKLDQNTRLIDDCNKKLEEHKDELLGIPGQINDVNSALMLLTMEYCYGKMLQNTDEIREINGWVDTVRVELKKKLIRKQEKELQNHQMYSFMHDIFGMDVISLFDLKYSPQEPHPEEADEDE